METAFLVDWALFQRDPELRRWLNSKSEHVTLILMVDNPETDDYEPKEFYEAPNLEFGAIIRNSGKLVNVVFKWRAVETLHAISNYNIVAGFDPSDHVCESYESLGVLFTNRTVNWN